MKNKTTTTLLALFLVIFGIYRFYLNQYCIQVFITPFDSLKATICNKHQSIDTELQKAITLNEALLEFWKFGNYLLINFKMEILKERYFDFEGALLFLERVRLVGVEK